MKPRLIPFLIVIITPAIGFSAGKKPTPPPVCGDPSTVALPVRKVVLTQVGTNGFQLPNGAMMDLRGALDAMMTTAVTETPNLAVTSQAPGIGVPCESYIRVDSKLSTISLEALKFGITFGYSPSGADNPVTDLTGTADVRLGTMAMDFHIYQCANSAEGIPQCQSVAATMATHAVFGGDLKFEIDFGVVKTGPALVYNTPLEGIFRAVINNGIKKLAAHPRIQELDWNATVTSVVPGAIFTFDAGSRSRIGPNQRFYIYSETPATSGCQVREVVGEAHTTRVDLLTSTAVVDKMFVTGRDVRVGDQVWVNAQPQR